VNYLQRQEENFSSTLPRITVNKNYAFGLHYMFFLYKHMEFRNQAQLCFAIYDFEAHIMLSLYLNFQGTGLPVWKKI